jgi:hypothetical protein
MFKILSFPFCRRAAARNQYVGLGLMAPTETTERSSMFGGDAVVEAFHSAPCSGPLQSPLAYVNWPKAFVVKQTSPESYGWYPTDIGANRMA